MQQSENQGISSGITLILGAGLLKMAAAIGVMQTLARENIPIRMVIGSSTGALYAASLALGFTDTAMQELATRIGSLYGHSLPKSRTNWLSAQEQKTQTAYQQILEETFGEKTFADTRLPLHLVVTNFLTGELVDTTQGKLVPYLLASCGVAGLMPPVKSHGQLFTDGALSEPLPISIAASNASVIILVGFKFTLLSEVKTPRQRAFQANSILINVLMDHQIALNSVANSNEIIHLNPRIGVVVELSDTKYIPFIIEKGAEAAQQVIPYLKSVLTVS